MIPAMLEVLHSFSINPSHLNTVPLTQYHWWEFECSYSDPNSTISQRIRTLTKNTRGKINNDELREKLEY